MSIAFRICLLAHLCLMSSLWSGQQPDAPENNNIEIAVGSSDIAVEPACEKKKEKPQETEEQKKENPEKENPEIVEKKQEEQKKELSTESSKPTPKSPHQFTWTVGIFSDYRSRGISQTMLEPCIQGQFVYKHDSGFYIRNWASNVDGTGNFITNTSMEWDIYVGVLRPFFNTKLQYEAGFLLFWYPGGQARVPAQTSYNTVEYYFALSYKEFEIKLSQTVNNFFGVNSKNPPINWSTKKPVRPNGNSYSSPYLEANYTWSFYPKWKAAFHLGYQGVTNYPQLSYVDFQVTIGREFEWFDAFLYFVTTNARHDFYDVPDDAFKPRKKKLGASGVVFGIAEAF